MKREHFLKVISFLPFMIYLLATQIWEMSFQTQIIALVSVIIIGLLSVLLRAKMHTENRRHLYLKFSLALILVIAVFSYQYFGGIF